MSGSLGRSSSPSMTCRSVRQMPQTVSWTNTCSGPGWGIGTSFICSGPVSTAPVLARTMAFIVDDSMFIQGTGEGGRSISQNDCRQHQVPMITKRALWLGLNTFDVELDIDVVPHHQPAAIQCFAPHHAEIFAIQLPFRVKSCT